MASVTRVKCALPIKLADKQLKDIQDSSLLCSESSSGGHESSFKKVNLSPSNPQMVVEGDELSFHCQLEQSSVNPMWLVNDNPLASDSRRIQITSAAGHSVLTISKLETAFKGAVICQSSSDPTYRASVDVMVLPQNVPVCNPITLTTSHGDYKWGYAIAGVTVRQDCHRASRGKSEVSLQCRQTGEWSASANVSESCAYTSQVTETLHKFATMNTSFTRTTLLESAKHFLNYTSDPKLFQNPMDVVYFSQAVENYLPYLVPDSNDVGHYMLDFINNILAVSPSLLHQAQKNGMACRRLLNVMNNITAIVVPAFRHHYDTLAMETFMLPPHQRFDGISCAWYENSEHYINPYSPRRVFHCIQGNKTVLSPDKKLLASLTVPNTLLKQHFFTDETLRLMFVAFDNASLFPTATYMKMSQIIGCKLQGGKRNINLTQPVTVIIGDTDPTQSVMPVVWDEYANGGQGTWKSGPCQLISRSVHTQSVTFSCSRLGFFGLSYGSADISDHDNAHVSRWHHPVLYVGGCISALLLLLTIVIFSSQMPTIGMATELKHSYVNIWFTALVLIYLFITGIYQVNYEVTCRLVAFALHFFMISSLLWILLGVYVIYSKVSGLKTGISGAPSLDRRQHPNDKYEVKPMPIIRLYFFAYGAPALIVILTASIAIDSYHNSNHCFLNWQTFGPLIGGLAVPCILTSTVMIGFSLSILCVLSGSPYKVASNDVKEPSYILDDKQTPRRALLSLILQYLQLVSCFTTAGLLMMFTDYATWLSVVVSIVVACLGIYVFVTFCLLRHNNGGQTGSKSIRSALDENEDIAADLVELCPRPLPQHPPPMTDHYTASLRPNNISGESNLFNNHKHLPKTSSPANSHIQVQDLTVSPLMAAQDSTEPYSIVPLAYVANKNMMPPPPLPPEMSLASVNTGLSYTDSSTIKVGAPCDLATFDLPSSASLINATGTPKHRLLLNHGGNHNSSSLPRSLRNYQSASRRGQPQSNNDDLLETQSKFSALSMGSSRSGHSRTSGGARKRHKKPNRRRPRPAKEKEPLYNNVGDDNYLGDDDQFDTLERHRRTIALPDELPSIIHEVEDDEENEEAPEDDELQNDEILSQDREELASLEDLPPPNDQFDMPKRETSV